MNTENAASIPALLNLQSATNMAGAPTLHLSLHPDEKRQIVGGSAEVTQALAQPVVYDDPVCGVIIWETVMPPGQSKVRFDLTGPSGFTAMIVLDTTCSEGIVKFAYKGGSQVEQQIHRIR